MADAQTIRGTIAQANDGGLKLEDQEDWYNFGQRYKGSKQFKQGQQVELKYVRWQGRNGEAIKFYINSALVLNGAPQSGAAKSGLGAAAPRELMIMRESVLKTAVEFMRLRGEAPWEKAPIPSLEELLLNAEALESWCLGERNKEPDVDEPPPPEEPPPESDAPY